MTDADPSNAGLPGISCPVPQPPGDCVLLAHGEGARSTRRLIRDVLVAAFDNEFLRPLGDGAILPAEDRPLVMTTDSYVVSPLFFPGGDIGKLAVHGTINDLAVSGASPEYLSLAIIAEEGLPLSTLKKVVASIRDSARLCRVHVVTGDFKVVLRGAADQLFVNTTGIGHLRPGVNLSADRVRAGDRILVSGTIGDHGLAVLTARQGLDLESNLMSDTAPLHELVETLLNANLGVRFLRDPTRGGVSAVLHELAEATELTAVVTERAVPLKEAVRGASELLGLDPLYVANEGKLIVVVAPEDAERALECMRRHPLGRDAAIIGEVVSPTSERVLVQGTLGIMRVLDEPSGAPLPRIC